MRTFIKRLKDDLVATKIGDFVFIAMAVMLVYGVLAFQPITAYDFASAKSSSFQVFLTYFFMHRPFIGLIAALFADFSPLWNCGIGVIFIGISTCLIRVLFVRLGCNRYEALVGAILWLSTPFLFCLSIYQHAMPSMPIAICFDAIGLLCFQCIISRKNCGKEIWAIAILCVAFSTGVYQAHTTLLLTGMCGLIAASKPSSWGDWFRATLCAALVVLAGIIIWALVGYGPMCVAKMLGIAIPRSGGTHDAIVWFSGNHSFVANVKALCVGLILNWGYNAFFIVGLRWVLLALLAGGVLSIALFVKHRTIEAVSIMLFDLSVFSFPVLQGTAANLRTHFCLIPLIVFTVLLLLMYSRSCRKTHALVCLIAIVCAFSMGHETATLYYHNWKVKHLDEIHYTRIAHDYWRLYGFDSQKPVAVVGGWHHYPAVWEDMRPFRELPLVNHPLTTYSNVSKYNVPREFYMVAREKVGLVMPMPDLSKYEEIGGNASLIASVPAYPSEGYIKEVDGVVVINLGHDEPWRRFEFKDYLSPNEKLLLKTIRADRFDSWLIRVTQVFRNLAEKYPWALEV